MECCFNTYACMQVWENLTLKDMARAAGTCKDFAMQAKETRSDLRTLKLPPGAVSVLLCVSPGMIIRKACMIVLRATGTLKALSLRVQARLFPNTAF